MARGIADGARHLLSRVGSDAALVLAVLVLGFLLVHLAPGDPIDTLAGQMGGMSEASRHDLRAAYGLDRPVYVQLLYYLGRVIGGDLGYSYYFDRPVSALIFDRLPATLLLLLTAIVAAAGVGTISGVLAARAPNGLLSRAITVASVVGYALPLFWTGMLLVMLFASAFPILPVSGMRSPIAKEGWLSNALDVARHLVLPAVSLALVHAAQYSRLTRAGMIEVLGSDFVRTARAKGLNETAVLFRHALRNAILPILTLMGLQFGSVLAGAIVVETVFDWPGLGRLAVDSVLRRDYPTLLGLLFFSSLLVIAANQITDLCYRRADPRITGN